MPRQSRKLRGGLSQTRRALIPLLQDQENAYKDVTDPKLLTLKVRDAKDYLKKDILESIRVLQTKLASLDQPVNNDDMLWTDYVKKEIDAMTYMSKGKSIKGVTGAIAAYNVFSQGQDKFRSVDRQKTPYPCGTVTCKERGQKMKEALNVLSSMSADALGSFGMSGAIASAFDWAVRTRSRTQYIDQDYATFLGLPTDLIQDLTIGDTETALGEIELSTLPSKNPAQSPAAQAPAAQSPTAAAPAAPAAAPAKKWSFWGGKRTRRR